MAKAETTGRNSMESCMNVEFMRYLVKQYSELGQWTSAFFWADAAAAAAGSGPDAASGDDVWLLASTMLARGELHRAAHAVTSRELHKRHLLCLGVAMRAYLSAKEPVTALNLLEECDPMLLEPRNTDDMTHNRALAAVLVWQARAFAMLERREAAATALTNALRADTACYEALDLLLEQHSLSPSQERELLDSLPFTRQLSTAEGTLLQAAYRERLNRYTPAAICTVPADTDCPVKAEALAVGSRTRSARCRRALALAGACRWREALGALEGGGPWCCAALRAACLLELNKSAELFAFAHTLVDAYPQSWTSWFAVGCYYYLTGKSEYVRRYLCKAKSLEPTAGCVWLLYGHSFAFDTEHDQAMAAYFKAGQLMSGCHLPPLYVGVQCSLLNNETMCEKFLAKAAALHNDAEEPERSKSEELSTPTSSESEREGDGASGWVRIWKVVRDAHVAHEAGAAAFAAGNPRAAAMLFKKALQCATTTPGTEVCARWAPTMDALGHATRALGHPAEALQWHARALALRPARAHTLAAMGLCLALLGREVDAADVLHSALARDPDDVVSLALLDAIVDRLDAALTDKEIPLFPFPAVNISVPAATTNVAPHTPASERDNTNTSDMSMSFD